MERISRLVGVCLLTILCTSCASFFTKYDKDLLQSDEFDQIVKVEGPEVDEPVVAKSKLVKSSVKVRPKKSTPKPVAKKFPKKKITSKKTVVKNRKSKVIGSKKVEAKKNTNKVKKHLPSLEDSEGFDGRRPIADPIQVGESSLFSVTYFGVEAGTFKMSVKSFKHVNGKKSYHLHYQMKTSNLFSWFYKLDDTAETYLAYDDMVPLSYALHVKESGQVREVRGYIDHKKNTGFVWDKKIPKGKSLEEKKYEWKVEPFSQTPFSVAFYFRTFQFKIGKEYQVRVAHEGDNMLMKVKAIRREKLKTSEGILDTLVIKPTFELNGMFKPTGENFIWVTDDDRKQIVRIESKIRIGTMVAKLVKLER